MTEVMEVIQSWWYGVYLMEGAIRCFSWKKVLIKKCFCIKLYWRLGSPWAMQVKQQILLGDLKDNEYLF